MFRRFGVVNNIGIKFFRTICSFYLSTNDVSIDFCFARQVKFFIYIPKGNLYSQYG